MAADPYKRPKTIKQVASHISGSIPEEQTEIMLAVKDFVRGGISSKEVDLEKQLTITVDEKNTVNYQFTVDQLLDDNLGFPLICEFVVNQWEQYTHIKCPMSLTRNNDDSIQEFPYTINIDTESNILFISFMLVFWDIFKIEILKAKN